jgi:hypothetical protein
MAFLQTISNVKNQVKNIYTPLLPRLLACGPLTADELIAAT